VKTKIIKSIITRITSSFGYVIVRSSLDNLSYEIGDSHPLEHLLKHSNYWAQPFSIPITKIRSWGGRRLVKDLNPFIDVISDYKTLGAKEYLGSALEKFSNKRSSTNAAETLGLSPELAPGFATIAPYLAIFPWEPGDPRDHEEQYHCTLERELSSYVNKDRLKLITNKDVRGQAEIHRILKIGSSIENSGFSTDISDYHPIVGQLLIDESQRWVVLIRQGEHRVAALAAAEELTIPVVLSNCNIVRIYESDFWPQVINNRITKKGANNVFLRIMNGAEDAPLVNISGFFI
jgi:hypothetical protein